MKSRFSLLIFMLCFIMLLPNVASATEFEISNSNLTFSSNDEGRAVTPEEFELISDTLIDQQENNSSITLEEVIEQLGLENVEVYYEDNFGEERISEVNESERASPQSINVGFENVDRGATAFTAQATLINYEPTNFRFIGKIEGFNRPAANVGGGYVKTVKDKYFNLPNVGQGVTKVYDKLYMAHHGVDAIYTIEAIIQSPGAADIPRYYEVKTFANSPIRTNIYKPSRPYDQQ